MTAKEALALLESTCLIFMVNIQKENRPRILEAADVLRELLPKEEEEKKPDQK